MSTPAPPTAPLVLPDVTLITGPLVLGFMFGTGLYGILCVQVFLYHTSFPNDPKWMKIYVAIIFLLETIFSVFSTIAAWNTLGKGWGHPDRLTYLDWSSAPLPPISGLITTMVHAFYCWRIIKLIKNFWLPLIIMLVSLTQFGMTIALMVHLGIFGLDVDAVRSASQVVTVWLAGAAVADILVAVTMVTILLRARRSSGFTATASRLHRVIKLVVETGLITSVAAILDCSLFLRWKDTNLHFIMFYMLAKLYSNTIMATLNSRVIFNMITSQGVVVTDIQATSAFWQDESQMGSSNTWLRSPISPVSPTRSGGGVGGGIASSIANIANMGKYNGRRSTGIPKCNHIHISTETAVMSDVNDTELKRISTRYPEDGLKPQFCNNLEQDIESLDSKP